ncbi:MAG: DmsE family decaheme c-type cytochrome [Desulfuromonadales bacterium]|nr:DmsE family decaheme c-type cytochrome [Desulfuromonadales bacterium]MDW7756874.1 DmsE family decaheme c-type cytochrome [Desulfuromonadales bacterium]
MIRTIFLLIALGLLYACSDLPALRADHPLLPVRAYEQLIVGRLDADYVGDANCLAQCHKHDEIHRDFQMSVHGEQISPETGLPLVNCESCHGPGSLAILNAKENDKCDFKTLLQLEELPAQAQSLICLKCHSAASTPNLHYWNGSIHASSDVSCFDCHKLHQGPQQKVSRQEMDEMCYACHINARMEFAQFSRHPVRERKMACVDCHEPHGSAQKYDLKGITVKDLCTRCHMDKQGPFVYEHADLADNCLTCHSHHGSANNSLLRTSEPFLCLQCHAGHQDYSHPSLATDGLKGAFYSRCTSCHSSIHGTDVPSAKGRGTFIAR